MKNAHQEYPTVSEKSRSLLRSYSGRRATDGDNVKLTRYIGGPSLSDLDPFLLLDRFESDKSQDYIGGFPTHPHRGFETVTYLLNGRMRHRDSTGREGVIEPGGVQWMTAGRGILHSEMPEQTEGLLKGFQLWVNLPAKEKMREPGYQEFSSETIPVETLDSGGHIRVIAGETDGGTVGPVVNSFTSPIYLDVTLPKDVPFEKQLPVEHNAFLYVISGSLSVGTLEDKGAAMSADELGVLSTGEQVSVVAGPDGVRFMLIAAEPLKEPVARSGPFVMNTREELYQAYEDFRSGNF